MEMERKAMYNLLRMNWLRDPDIRVEAWQVEDYRSHSLHVLFDKLENFDISIDTHSFAAYAENYDTPEELAECLAPEGSDAETEDQIYLIIFELWRRLVPEKPSLSIFCDEIDQQIYLYDEGQLENPETLQDALAYLATILEENVDAGGDPQVIFQSIEAHCGNSLESFLYDFIAEQIDEELFDYSFELVDLFYPFVEDKKWFDFLRARIIAPSNMKRANTVVRELLDEFPDEINLEFHLEILQFLSHWGDHHFFLELAKKAALLITTEDEFQDLLIICSDYFKCLDHDREDTLIQQILARRSNNPPDASVEQTDADLASLKKLFDVYEANLNK